MADLPPSAPPLEHELEPADRGRGVSAALRQPVTRRVSWSVADQALSSLTNAVLAIVVARATTARGLGAFELAFSLYLFLLVASRAVASAPLLVRPPDPGSRDQHRAVGESAGTALAFGLVAGAVVACVALPLGQPTRGALLALAVSVPGLLLQDAWRHVFFSLGTPARAAANDAVWAVVQFSALLWLSAGNDPSVTVLVLAWGAAAGLGAAFGAWQANALPVIWGTGRWLRRHIDLAPRFLGESTVGVGATALSFWLIGVVGGLTALGTIRAASVVLGPIRVLMTAASTAAIPEMVRLHRRSAAALWRGCLVIAMALTASVLLAGAVAAVVPRDLGERLLGDNWLAARRVLLPVTVTWAFLGWSTGATVGLRALADARRSLRSQLWLAPAAVVLPAAAVAAWGAAGGAWGMAVAALATAVVLWQQFRRSAAEGRKPSPMEAVAGA